MDKSIRANQYEKAYGKKELEEINKFRREMGMKEIRPRSIPCMRCNKLFHSCDPKNVRFCPECRRVLTENEEWYADESVLQTKVGAIATQKQGCMLRGDEKEVEL